MTHYFVPVSDWPSRKRRETGVFLERFARGKGEDFTVHLRIMQGAASSSIELSSSEAEVLAARLWEILRGE